MLADLRKDSRTDFRNGRNMGNIRGSFSDTEGSGFHVYRGVKCNPFARMTINFKPKNVAYQRAIGREAKRRDRGGAGFSAESMEFIM